MKSFSKNLLIIFVVLLIISGFFTLYSEPANQKTDSISLSELVREINQEQVQQIIIADNILEIKLTNNALLKARKESELALTQSLINYGVQPEKLAQVDILVQEPSGWQLWLSGLMPLLLPFAFIGLFIWMMMRGVKKTNFQAMSFGRSLARVVRPEKDGNNKKKGVTFKDVAGLKEAKVELEEVVEFLKHPKKFTKLGAKIPKGVLLIGPPGCGKTLLARAVANEADVAFFNISGSEFVEMFVGVGASRVRDLFGQAKKHAPAIIFIDELDAIGRARGAMGLGGGHDEREQTLNQILVEMDGFEADTGIIVLAASNRPDVIDSALLRPGRFDRRVTLNMPDIKERKAILEIHAQGKPLANKLSLRNIAERTPGFSGADLANLVNEAAILAARRNKKKISLQELRESIEKVLLGPERKSRVMSKQEKKITAYHEAGHALATALLEHTDPVQKVSIIPRGQAGGYTMKAPATDKSLKSKSEFLDELAVLLGGYISEKIIFKELTTGAVSDLQEATRLARKMVTEYGMSKLGPIQYRTQEESDTFGYIFPIHNRYSEATAAKIDAEIRSLISQAEKNANQILLANKQKLAKIAKRLIKKETIEKEEFERLMGA